MKLTTKKLRQIIKEELKALLKENAPGYYIDVGDGFWNEDPYDTEEAANAAIDDLPPYIDEDDVRIVKID